MRQLLTLGAIQVTGTGITSATPAPFPRPPKSSSARASSKRSDPTIPRRKTVPSKQAISRKGPSFSPPFPFSMHTHTHTHHILPDTFFLATI